MTEEHSPSPLPFAPPKGFETRFPGLPLKLAGTDVQAFEGPLDLLLFLIRENRLDILNLPMLDVTRQYMNYLELMEELNLEIAAEFVAMAAHLLAIKSRMMLPRPPASEEDPRIDLVQKLLDYQQVKQAAQQLLHLEEGRGRYAYAPGLDLGDLERTEEEPIRVTLFDLLRAYRELLQARLPPPPVEVRTPPKTLDQRVFEILALLSGPGWRTFESLFEAPLDRDSMVLTFLALLELVRLQKIQLVQTQLFGEIRIQAA